MAGTFGSPELRENIHFMAERAAMSPQRREIEDAVAEASGGWLSSGPYTLDSVRVFR